MSATTSAEVAEAVARHNVRNRKMTGVLTVSALLDELDRLREELSQAVPDTEQARPTIADRARAMGIKPSADADEEIAGLTGQRLSLADTGPAPGVTS